MRGTSNSTRWRSSWSTTSCATSRRACAARTSPIRPPLKIVYPPRDVSDVGTGVSGDDRLVARTRAELGRAGGAILIDLEFTCWEDLPTCGWGANDPRRLAVDATTRGLANPLAGRG